MKAQTRAVAWLVFMLAFGTLMTLFWANFGGQLMQQIVRLLSF